MKRLILVAAAPNRFFQQHQVPLGSWVITDPELSVVHEQMETLRVQEVLDVQQGAMRYQSGGVGEVCFLTNPNDPLFNRIKRDSRNPGGNEFVNSYGPVFKLKTHHGVLRWFVANASGRHAIRGIPLEQGYSFVLSSNLVQSTAGYSYHVPRIMA
jgi:hypothetical protein